MLQLFYKRFERERERQLGICILDSTHHVFLLTKESVFLRIRK